MAELEERLNSILTNPEAMGQIVNIAKALTGEGNASPTPTDAPQQEYTQVESEPPPAPPPAPAAQQPDWSAVIGLLSGGGAAQNTGSTDSLAALKDIDPKLISAAVRLFSEYSASDDRKIALLAALKPFLKEERYAKMDKAIQIARLSRVIRVAFQLFKKEEGPEDV